MSKLYGDEEELTADDAAVVKGMIERGDKNENIAAYFGVNQRATNIRSGKKFNSAKAAPREGLPPPGPYGVDPIYVHFYQTMVKVDRLWSERKLRPAKELMEKALKNPVFASNLEVEEELLSDLIRDEFGLATIT